MLPIYLRDGSMVVFWLSLLFMALTLVARVAVCVRYYVSGLVKPDKLFQFMCVSCLYILEPNAGITSLRPLLVTEKVEKNSYGYVMSSHSLQHDHDKLAMKSGLDSAYIMLFTEDLPELIISLIYLFKRGSEADPFFFVSLVTTMFHALRQLFEIYHTNQFRDVNAFLLEHMRYEIEGKSFEDASKTLQTYGMY